MIEIKSENELELIFEAGKIVKLILGELKCAARPGVTTADLGRKAAEIIKKSHARSAFLGYRGFPGVICASLNEQVVHGIPGDTVLSSGDILSIDVGIEKNGYYADSALTIPVGDKVSQKARSLIEVTEKALYLGIEKAIEGNRLFDISNAIQKFAESHGYGVVRGFVGHGIGKDLHEDPEVPNFGKQGTGPRLKSGMVLAIEPMINEGGYEVEILSDGWTAVTKDRLLSAHFEHTVTVTEREARILT
ncbi:MAG: type I methionyl aminopeptidase [Candidatus Omnitrophica bacterium CG1_02_40_15]|nr:MAG: type I methionyl aminopeptidase [Candidatus Omnitrophica bacterium CG1_02_40_15]